MKFKHIMLLSGLLLLTGCSSSDNNKENAKEFNLQLESASKIDSGTKLNKETKQEEEVKPVEEVIDPFKLNNELQSQTYILKDLSSGEIILDHNKDNQVSVASLTKIMTAYILLDKNKDVKSKVTMDPQVITDLQAEGASMAGFLPEDELTIEDLLYGTMLPSGGDAAVMTARYISGTEASFAEEMNKYAQDLGMINTSFKNPNGLDQDGHKSTVNDLLILLTEALKNPEFHKLFTTLNHQGQPTKLNPSGYTYNSTLTKFDLGVDGSVSILGGKTGFTGDAGLCLASIINLDGKEYALITTGAPVEIQGSHVSDAISVYKELIEYKVKG